MVHKFTHAVLALFMIFTLAIPSSHAAVREASASLFLPTTGQAMNGEIGSTKTKIMAGIEVAAITTTAILGGVVGGGVVWVGLGPLLANHLWSSVDAYQSAKRGEQDPFQGQSFQMSQAQRTLDLSRQRRFEREQALRTDLRSRVAQAGETAFAY